MMVAGKLIRWSPFFAGLSEEQVVHIARVAEEMEVDVGYCFFSEGQELDTFYLVQEGTVDLTIAIPERNKDHNFVDQLTRSMDFEQVTVSTINPGEIFGWSAIIPPHESTAFAIASTPCRVVAINICQLSSILEKDYELAYSLAIKAAQTIRGRLRDIRIESLAFIWSQKQSVY